MGTPETRIAKLLAVALVVGLVAGCGDDGPTGLDPNVFELVVVSGAGQSGVAGTTLADPLVVAVRRKSGGAGEEGATVTWRVIQGDGEVTRTSAVTDADGLATTRIVLGDQTGPLEVEARVLGLDRVILGNLTALPAPAIQSLSASSADPGDIIDVVVTDLTPEMSIDILFDGVAGEITERVDGSPATLRTVVPAPAGVCSPTTDVAVRLRVDGYTGPTQSLTVSVPALPFSVGQVLVMESSSDVDCAVLPADGGTAKYMLVALSAEFEDSVDVEVSLGGSSVLFSAAEATARAAPESFDTRLRAFERELVARGLADRGLAPGAMAQPGAQLFAQPSLGSSRDFWVIKNTDALPDATRDDFDRVTATLKFIGTHTLLYLDDVAPSPGLTDTDIEELGFLYDLILYESDVDYFGEPTDFDNNDRVIILLTATVNKLTPRGADGTVVGFFFGLDLADPATTGCDLCEFSNDGELFYGLVPDEEGIYSDPRERTRTLEVLPGVMIHETEHMINFRYKIFVNGRANTELLWLSEGLAHMAEELGGDAADVVGEDAAAENLYLSNFGRAASFLEDPGSNSLTVVKGGGTLGERGAGWLFLRWLADQYGDFIFRDIAAASPNGVANIEAQTGEDFFRLYADWAVAVWADDLNIPGLAARYQFPKWQLRSILVTGNGEPPAYILQPEPLTFLELRTSGITRQLAASSPLYVDLAADGELSDLQLELSALAAAGLAVVRYE
ncbi:MAG: hypothetical protein PVJ64_04600 [Gemmatimonadales bacterium]|jgi:hypothetical protein